MSSDSVACTDWEDDEQHDRIAARYNMLYTCCFVSNEPKCCTSSWKAPCRADLRVQYVGLRSTWDLITFQCLCLQACMMAYSFDWPRTVSFASERRSAHPDVVFQLDRVPLSIRDKLVDHRFGKRRRMLH